MDSKFQEEYLEEITRMTRQFADAVSVMNKAIKEITDLGDGYGLDFDDAIAEITDVKWRLCATHALALDMLMESI